MAGIKPIITFLCENVDAELAFLCEQMAIEKWGRKDLGTGTLLNRNKGGAGFGTGHGPATRCKIAETSAERWKDPAYNARVGNAISQSKFKPCIYLGKEYPSLNAAAAAGSSKSTVRRHPSFHYLEN